VWTCPRPIDRRSTFLTGLGGAGALVGIGAVYWLSIYPQVRHELSRWRRYAHSIPDPVLREQALYKLTVERLNPEAAALFAALAPRRKRSRVVRLIVAYQILYDYLDAVNELPGGTDLLNGLQLHRALVDAVLPDQPHSDYYLHNPRCQDGGYALALAETCRLILGSLASAARIAPILALAADRCGQAQSRNHAIVSEGKLGLIEWSLEQASGCDYLWWELAAGGISCLAIHALFALAAEPASTIHQAIHLDAAYFPPICAVSALLDSLADYHDDAGTANHSFTGRYRDSAHAAERFAAIATDAIGGVGRLGQHRRHVFILSGIVAFYLSSPTVGSGFPALVAEHLMFTVGRVPRLMCAVMRLRRRVHSWPAKNSQGPE
jgi:tetraprenyl-beta-curcumene synthase